MRSKLLAAAALAALLFTGTGCIHAIDKRAFGHPIGSSRHALEEGKVGRTKMVQVYQAALKQTSTPKAAPYPELAVMLKQMDQKLAEWGAGQVVMEGYQAEFERLCGDRPDVSSDRPEAWAKFEPLYERSKAKFGEVYEVQKAFVDVANRCSGIMNDNGMMLIPASDVKGQLSGATGAMDKAVEELHSQTAMLRQKLKERTAATLGLDQQKKRNAILDQIVALGPQMEAASASLKGKVGAFEAALAGRTEIVQGPGIPKIKIVEEVTKDFDKINDLSSQLKKLVNEWNAMNN